MMVACRKSARMSSGLGCGGRRPTLSPRRISTRLKRFSTRRAKIERVMLAEESKINAKMTTYITVSVTLERRNCRSNKSITLAPDRFNTFGIGGGKFLTEILQMNVNNVTKRVMKTVPDVGQDILACHDSPPVSEQVIEQAVLSQSQLDRLTIDRHDLRSGV